MPRTLFSQAVAVATVVIPAAAGFVGPEVHAQVEQSALNVGGVDRDGATIKGTVGFIGRQARRRPIPMNADPYCAEQHADQPALAETFVFGEPLEGGGDDGPVALQNVFVYVSGGLSEDDEVTADRTPVIDQVGCVYIPHIQAVQVDQTLEIHNSDATQHNVNCQARTNDGFNVGMPAKGMVIERTFSKPEMAIPLKCDVHPWMLSYLHVMEHPYYAITQADGTFELRGLSAGTYQVSVWHEFDKFTPEQQTIEVTVGEGETAEASFTYRPPQRR